MPFSLVRRHLKLKPTAHRPLLVAVLAVLLSSHVPGARALRLTPRASLQSRWPSLAGRSQWKESRTCITDERCGGLYDDDDDDDAKLAITDACILRAVTLRSQQPLTRQYKPMAWWLWMQWDGTVLKKTYASSVYIVVVYLGLTLLVASPKLLPACFALSIPSLAPHLITARLEQMMVRSSASTPHLSTPASSTPARHVPQTFWQQHATITTFIVTFFLSKAYEYWRAQLKLARGVQGRLQELRASRPWGWVRTLALAQP